MRKSERIPLRCDVEFRRHAGNRYAVDLIDLSPEGCCISPPIRVEPGESVWLRIPDMEATHGSVAWVQEWKVGVTFDRAFHPAVFDDVVRRLGGAD
jgi:hypothetical protein